MTSLHHVVIILPLLHTESALLRGVDQKLAGVIVVSLDHQGKLKSMGMIVP